MEEISDFSLPFAKQQEKLRESLKLAVEEKKSDDDEDAGSLLKARRKTAAEKVKIFVHFPQFSFIFLEIC
jgi:hypothetical protein